MAYCMDLEVETNISMLVVWYITCRSTMYYMQGWAKG
jgi:hypothetical protein